MVKKLFDEMTESDYVKGYNQGCNETLIDFECWRNLLIREIKKEGKLKENNKKLDYEYVIDEIRGCFHPKLKELKQTSSKTEETKG